MAGALDGDCLIDILGSTSPPRWRECCSPTREPRSSASTHPTASASIPPPTRTRTAASEVFLSTSSRQPICPQRGA